MSGWNDHQMGAVRNLEISPREDCTVTKFEVEEYGSFIAVFRSYVPNHAPTLVYNEGFRVGPRGAITTVYRTSY